MQPDYKFYATLLDSFQNYLDSEKNWEAFYGDKPDSPTLEEYEDKSKKELIDRINRIPFESDAADKGTAFNEVIDCIIEHRKSDKMDIKTIDNLIQVNYRDKCFMFPVSLCREFSDYFKGAISQQYVESVLKTKYGNVLLYGYIDELMPLSVHDIKTTSHYSAYKFRSHWQHFVYPYCLINEGEDIHTFEYNITDFKNTFTETYVFDEKRDIPILTSHAERFIEFIIANRDLITDKKILGGEK